MALTEGLVPKFIQRRTIDMWMFGFVDAIHTEFPSVGVKKAISMFASRYELTVDEFNEESAFQTYYRMKEELKTFNSARKS